MKSAITSALLACLALAPAAGCVAASAEEAELGEHAAAISTTDFAFEALQFTAAQSARTNQVVSAATNNVTLEAWIRWDGGTQLQGVAYNGNSSSSGFGLYVENGTPRVLVGGKGWVKCLACTLTPGVWSHIAAVRSAGVWAIYLNGVAGALTGSATVAPNVPAGLFSVGSSPSGTEGFNGAIDEVRAWNVARTPQQIATYRTVALMGDETGLAAYYRLDEGQGGAASDSSPGDRPLTLVNQPIWISSGADITTGIARDAIQLTGAASAHASTIATTQTSQITLEAWVRWDGGMQLQGVVYNGNALLNGYGIYLLNGGVQLLAGGVGWMPCTDCALVPGAWTHLAAVRTSDWQLFQDGALKTLSGTGAPVNTPSGGQLSLASTPSGGDGLIGAIDEVRVWTVARTEEEIESASTVSLTGTEAGLVAYYRLDEGTGAIANDSAGAGGNLAVTLYGGPVWITSGAPLATVAP